MSDIERFSIWKDEPSMDSWYSAAVTRDTENRKGIDTSDMQEVLFFDIGKSNQVKHPSDDVNDWFYGATERFETTISMSTQDRLEHSPCLKAHEQFFPWANSRRITTDKPLPPVPDSPTSFAPEGVPSPYFDYLFANAGAGDNTTYGKHSPDNVSFEVDNEIVEHAMSDVDGLEETPSPKHGMPVTPVYSQGTAPLYEIDQSGSTTHAFLHAGIPITTKDLEENYRATAGTNLAGHFYFNEFDEAEKAEASANFYGGFAVEESPSPYHAPVTDQTSGFGDVRDGAEAFPEQWQNTEPRPRAFALAEADAVAQDDIMDSDSISSRPVLKPISRKHAAANAKPSRAAWPTVIDLTIEDDSQDRAQDQKTKRNARDSFVTKSTYDTSSSDDEEVKYLYTKKVRTIPDKDDHDARVSGVGRPTYSLITNPADIESKRDSIYESEVASVLTAGPEPTPVGYPGQFSGLKIKQENASTAFTFSSSPADKQSLIMGVHLHPNYLYTNTDFHQCPDHDKLDYTTRTARSESQVSRCIEHAYETSILSADVPRTAAEEALRREIHQECTMARLEGVSVGQYRYYQGSLNIEEYKEGNMCVCWEDCECSKLCTHFGDLICPCSKNIELHQH